MTRSERVRTRRHRIMLYICSEPGCSAIATAWGHWPGRRGALCGPHATQLQNTAYVEGLTFRLEPIDYESQRKAG